MMAKCGRGVAWIQENLVIDFNWPSFNWNLKYKKIELNKQCLLSFRQTVLSKLKMRAEKYEMNIREI